jgi:hypothetical protein
MDEMPRQLIKEVREPLPIESGKPERHDYHHKHHYRREGVVNLLRSQVETRTWEEATS